MLIDLKKPLFPMTSNQFITSSDVAVRTREEHTHECDDNYGENHPYAYLYLVRANDSTRGGSREVSMPKLRRSNDLAL